MTTIDHPKFFFLVHPVQFPSNHKTLSETSQVRVLDRLPQPPGPDEEVWGDPDRSYNLGLGGDAEGNKKFREIRKKSNAHDGSGWCW